MAILFPSDPTTGETFTAVGKTWTWNGAQWEGVPAVVSSGIPSGETADRPASPAIGDQFYNGTLGILEIYSNAGWVPSTGANDFNLSLTGSETSATLERTFFTGSYTISSSLNDTAFDTYLFNSNGDQVGYSSTPSISATGDFNRIVVIGGTAGDLLGFTYKVTYETQQENDDFNVSPYIESILSTNINPLNGTIVITGGNFSENVEVDFIDKNLSELPAKSIVRSSPTELIVTRPDELAESNGPFTVRCTNPGITSALGSNRHKFEGVSIKTASGGAESIVSGYRVHTFTGNGTFELFNSNATNFEYMIIAGGGAGASSMGGGGGAGGLIHNVGSPVDLSPDSYSIVVGAGATGTSFSSSRSPNGTNTTAFSLTAIGGGGSSSLKTARDANIFGGVDGGSGGAAGAVDTNESGNGGAGLQPGSASGGFGNAGGNVTAGSSNYPSGGGGGAGGVGQSVNSSTAAGGNGGVGLQINIDGNNYYWAAGGGGGSYNNGAGAGDGGTGGGGGGSATAGPAGAGGTQALNNGLDGGSGDNLNGGDAGANTGSGGGGASWENNRGGNGGSGIVIVRYPI